MGVTSRTPIAQANIGTIAQLAAGPSRTIAIWTATDSFSGDVFSVDIADDGSALVDTTKFLLNGYPRDFIAAGDAFYLAYSVNDRYDVHVRRLDTGRDIAIDSDGSGQLKWDGSRLMLLTNAHSGGFTGLTAYFFDRDLNAIGAPLAIDPMPASAVAGAANGSFFVILETPIAARSVRIDSVGKMTTVTTPATSLQPYAIASNGSEYLLVWKPDHLSVYAQRYSDAGQPIGGVYVITQTFTKEIGAPRAVWTGRDYVVAWQDVGLDAKMSQLFLRHVDETSAGDPILLGDMNFLTFWGAFTTYAPALGANSTHAFVAWPSQTSGSVIRRVDPLGETNGVAFTMPTQSIQSIAVNGTERAVIWKELGKTRFGRFAPDGTRLDGDGRVLTFDGDLGTEGMSSIAFDGVRYLVAFSAGPNVYGRFVTTDGHVDGDPFLITPWEAPPAPQWFSLAWLGDRYAALWDSGDGAFISTTGVVTPWSFSIGKHMRSAISAGPRPIAITTTAPSIQRLYSTMTATFLDDGTSVDITPGHKIWYFTEPRVVSNGSDYFVTWTETQSTISLMPLWAARLDATAHWTTPPISVGMGNYGSNDLAIPVASGNNYRIFVNGASMTAAVIRDASTPRFTTLPIDDGATRLFVGVAAVAAASDGRIAIAYDRATSDQPSGWIRRAFVRWTGEEPTPKHRAAGR